MMELKKRLASVCLVVVLVFCTGMAISVLTDGGDSGKCCKTFGCGREPNLGHNNCGFNYECAANDDEFTDCCFGCMQMD